MACGDCPGSLSRQRIPLATGEAAYVDGLRTRQARLQTATLAVLEQREKGRCHCLAGVPTLRRSFPTLDVEEQGEIIAQVLDVVFVAAGRGSAESRVTICPAGTARASFLARVIEAACWSASRPVVAGSTR
jgi:hypothetical protein